MFRSSEVIKRLKPFNGAFSLLLDIAGGPPYSSRHINTFTKEGMSQKWLTHLISLEFIKPLRLHKPLQMLPSGEHYIKQVRLAQPETLIPLNIDEWCEDTHWMHLLLGVDNILPPEIKQRWHRIDMCDAGGYTNHRGDQVLTALFHKHFDQVVDLVITAFCSKISPAYDKSLVYKYLARKLPYVRWADYLVRNDPQHIQEPSRRKVMLDLMREVKKL